MGSNSLKPTSRAEGWPSVIKAGLVKTLTVAITSCVIDAAPKIGSDTRLICSERCAVLKAAPQLTEKEKGSVVTPRTPISAAQGDDTLVSALPIPLALASRQPLNTAGAGT